MANDEVIPAPEITVNQFLNMGPESVQVIDVREQDEWDEGHIPAAKHIPLGVLEDRAGEIDPAQPVVVVCKSGGRSLIGATYLKSIGYDQAVSLAGGTQGWIKNGQPVSRD